MIKYVFQLLLSSNTIVIKKKHIAMILFNQEIIFVFFFDEII